MFARFPDKYYHFESKKNVLVQIQFLINNRYSTLLDVRCLIKIVDGAGSFSGFAEFFSGSAVHRSYVHQCACQFMSKGLDGFVLVVVSNVERFKPPSVCRGV